MEAFNQLADVSVSSSLLVQFIKSLWYKIRPWPKSKSVFSIFFCYNIGCIHYSIGSFIYEGLLIHKIIESRLNCDLDKQEIRSLKWFTERNQTIKADLFLEAFKSAQMGFDFGNIDRCLRNTIFLNTLTLTYISDMVIFVIDVKALW